jgi:phosphohistidine phosphatase SixA
MRRLMSACFLALSFAVPAMATMNEDAAWGALQEDAIVLFRHADAPGTGDPADFDLNDCATQRNLGADGRVQAARIGQAFAERGIVVTRVLTSQWCRARDTAELAFPGMATDAPALNSFFADDTQADRQTAEALDILRGWQGPGTLVVVTHMVNIAALTDYAPGQGEGVVIRVTPAGIDVVGSVLP